MYCVMVYADTLKKIISISIITSFLIQCTESQEFVRSPIPAHLDGVENLVVHSLDEETAPHINLVLNQVFGDNDDVFLGYIKKIAVDNWGRVFIADFGESRANALYGFDPDGTFLKRLGREGDGPGEFRHVRDMKVQSNQLFVYDGRQWIHIFDLESLTYSHTIVLNETSLRAVEELRSAFPGQDLFVREDDTFLVSFRQPVSVDGSDAHPLLYYLRDSEGNILPDKIFEQRDLEFFDPAREPAPGVPLPFTMPYSRSPLIAVSGDEHIYTAWSGDFLIREYDSRGNYLRAFYYPFEKSVLTRRDAIDMTGSEGFRKVLRDQELPETWPALHTMVLDDLNRLWVATITDDEEKYRWWVLDQDGEPLGFFEMEGDRQNRVAEIIERPVIKNGYFYNRETDEETGKQTVVRYQIEMETK